MTRGLPLLALMLLAEVARGACGFLPTDVVGFAGGDLDIDSGVTVNGGLVSGSGDRLGPDGSRSDGGVVIPDLDPSSHPWNLSWVDADDGDAPFMPGGGIFGYWDEIDIGRGTSAAFTGGGDYHIDQLTIERDAEVTFAAGRYFIEDFSIARGAAITITSGPVIIHVEDELLIDLDVRLNDGGDPTELRIYLHNGARFELEDGVRASALVVSPYDNEIILGRDVVFEGLLLTEGDLIIERDVQLTLAAATRSALAGVSTCEDGDVEVVVADATPIHQYRLDASFWSGAAGEVLDSIGGVHGSVLGDADGGAQGRICNAGRFPANTAGDQIDAVDTGLSLSADVGAVGSIGFWYAADADWGSGADAMLLDATAGTLYFFVMLGADGRVRFNLEDSADRDIRLQTPVQTFAADAWVHVTVTWNLPGDRYEIFLNGVLAASATNDSTGSFGTLGTIHIGDNRTTYYPSGSGNSAAGRIDEVNIFDSVISGGDIAALMAQSRDDCPIPADATGPRHGYHFDEAEWNGVDGEIVDAGSLAADGNRVGAPVGGDIGKVCLAGRFALNTSDGTQNAVDTTVSPSADLGDRGTIAFWYRSNGAWANGQDALLVDASVAPAYFYVAKTADGRVRFAFEDSADNDFFLQSPVQDHDEADWVHIAASWNFDEDAFALHLDGVLVSSDSFATTGRIGTTGTLYVGDNRSAYHPGVTSGSADGRIDEVLLYDHVISAEELTAALTAARDCPVPPGPSGLQLSHDGAGIYCAPETVQLTALAPGAGVFETYAGQVTLSTNTGKGTWRKVSGFGLLTDAVSGDGIATYQFSPMDNGVATFSLDYQEGERIVTIAAEQTDDPSIRDDASHGTLAFAPTGFVLTPTAISDPATQGGSGFATQTAGTAFDVHITAYGTDPEDGTCGVIEDYEGGVSLLGWHDHDNPASGALTTVLGGTVLGTSAGAGTRFDAVFNAGRASVAARYDDVGRIALNVRDDAGPVLEGGGAVLVAPATFVVTAVTDAAGSVNPGSSNTGSGFVAAGEAFRVVVEARNSLGNPTPNFGRESPAEGLSIRSASLDWPAGGINGSSDDGALDNPTAFLPVADGVFANASLAFDEVGTIRLQPRLLDGDYLGGGDVMGTISGPVGRFHPASFVLDSGSVSASCGALTFMGEPGLGLTARIEARTADAAIATNYDAALVGPSRAASMFWSVEDAGGGISLAARLAAATDAFSGGVLAVADSAATFLRQAAPDGPFDDVAIGVGVAGDPDGVVLTGSNMRDDTAADCSVAANCDAVQLGAGLRLRYGRLRLTSVSGPETAALSIPLASQSWNGAAFEVESADDCTVISPARASLGDFAGELELAATVIDSPSLPVPVQDGELQPPSVLRLAAPGVGNTGEVRLTLDVDDWLEFDWNGLGDQDPDALLRFGHFRGHDRILFWREAP